MENINCIVCSFKQSNDEPEYIYFVSDRTIVKGCMYINPDETPFMRVSYMLTQTPAVRSKIIEATDNPKYLMTNIDIQMIPKSFSEAYFKSGKAIKTAPLRVKIK